MKPVRCSRCDRKLAEHLEGLLIVMCPRCHTVVTVDYRLVLTERKT